MRFNNISLTKFMFILCVLSLSVVAYATSNLLSPITGQTLFENAISGKGLAPAPPAITFEKFNDKQTVRATVITNGKFQNIGLNLPEKYQFPIDKIEQIKLRVRWKMLPFYGEDCVISLRLAGNMTFNGNIQIKKDLWTDITLDVAPENLKIPNGVSYTDFADAKLLSLCLWPNNNLDVKGEFIEVESIQIILKSNETKTLSYSVKSIKPSPEKDQEGLFLSDNINDNELKQVQFPMFGEPELILDLKKEYAIDEFELNAIANPQINIQSVMLFTSNDGKKFIPVGVIENANKDTSKVIFQSFKKQKVYGLGRFLKIVLLRPRHDVPSKISEIIIKGHTPNKKERLARLAKRTKKNYFSMPAINDKNYYFLKNANGNLAVNKKNGMIAAVSWNKKKLIAGILPCLRYEPEVGKTKDWDIKKSKAIISQIKSNSLTVIYKNSDFPGLRLIRKYFMRDFGLEIETEINIDENSSKAFYLVGNEVILEPDFRKDGVYESSSVGHFISRKNASEIESEFAFDSYPEVFFENLKEKNTIFQFPLKRNGEFVPLDTESEYGGKHTRVTATGWKIFDTIFDSYKKSNSIVTGWILGKHSVIDAYLTYRSLPSFKSFYGWVKRSSLLKTVRCDLGPNDKITYSNAAKFLREGVYLHSSSVAGDFSWGDFITEGDIRSGIHEVQSVESLRDYIANLQKKYPQLKLGLYTWLWSVTMTSDFYTKHPDFFISKDRSGNPISFFPVGRANPYRNIANNECFNLTAKQILDYHKFYNLDIWYLDGGSSTTMRDWRNMRIVDPLAWHRFYTKVRREFQKQKKDGILFFNTTYQPLADIGLLENSGDIFTNWRTAATWFHRIKMFQLEDPNHYPAYIYWRPSADELFPSYLAVLGSFPALFHKRLTPDVIPYLSAQYEGRTCNIIDRAVTPDWRCNKDTKLESFVVQQGKTFLTLLRNHGKTNWNDEVTLDKQRLNIAKEQPLYSLFFSMRRYTDTSWLGRLAESEKEEIYSKTNWIEDALFALDFVAEETTLSKKFSLKSKTPYVWLVSTSNTFFYSIDNLVLQLPRTKTLEQEINGSYINNNQIKVEVDLNRNAEAITILPKGKVVKSICVAGDTKIDFRYLYCKDRVLVIYKVPANTKEVTISLDDKLKSNYNKKINGKFTVSKNLLKFNILSPYDLTMQIYEGEMLALTKKIAKGKSIYYEFPKGVRGGKYKVFLYDCEGKELYQDEFVCKGSENSIKMQREWPLPYEKKKINLSQKGKGFEIYAGHTHCSKGGFQIAFDKNKSSFSMSTQKMPPFYIVMGAMGYEMKCKRYLKIKLDGNFEYFNHYGKSPGHSRHPQVTYHALALFFDFHTPKGYLNRSLGSIGNLNLKYTSMEHNFDMKKNGYLAYYFISNWAFAKDSEDVFYLDLQKLGAPKNWDGKLYMGLIMDHVFADRRIDFEILESVDKLPADVKAKECLDLLAQYKTKKTFPISNVNKAVVVDGKKDAQYGNFEINDFSILGKPTVKSNQKSSVSFAKDNDNLYVLIQAEEKELGINDSQSIEGAYLFNVDSLEVVFELKDKKGGVYHLIISPSNKIYCKYEFPEQRKVIDAPHPLHAVSINADKKGWNAEFAIPLNVLNIQSNPKGLIGFNVMRNRYAPGGAEYLTLVPGDKYVTTERYKLEW